MATEAVEIILKAKDDASGTLQQAAEKVIELQRRGTQAAAAARVDFGTFTRAVSTVAPEAAQAASQVGSLVDIMGKVGATGAVGALGGVALGIAGVATAGLAAARSFANTVEHLDNLAAATGSSVADLQVLREIFERAGLGADAANTALVYLNRSIAEANPLLKALGVTARDPVNALLQLSQAFATSSDEALKTKAAVELMGRGGKDVLAVINQLAAEFPQLRSEMSQTNELFSKDSVDAARKFDKEWDRAAGRFRGFMAQIGGAAAIAVNEIVDSFNKPAPDKLTEQLAIAKSSLAELEKSAKFNLVDPAKLQAAKDEVAQLTRQVGIASGVIKEFGDDDLPMTASSADVAAKSVDRLHAAAALLGGDAPEVKKLMDQLHIGAGQAAAFLAEMNKGKEVPGVLQRIAVAEGGVSDKLAALARQIGQQPPTIHDLIGPEVPKQIDEALTKIRELTAAARGEVTPESGAFVGPPTPLLNRATSEGFEGLTAAQEAMAKFEQELHDAADSSAQSVSVLRDVFQTASASIEGFFETALTDAHRLSSAIVATIRSMVAQILAELVKIQLARAFSSLLGLLGLGLPTTALSFAASLPAEIPNIRSAGRSSGSFSAAGTGQAPGSDETASQLNDVVDAVNGLRSDIRAASQAAVTVDRSSFLETIGNAMVERDRRAALARGF